MSTLRAGSDICLSPYVSTSIVTLPPMLTSSHTQKTPAHCWAAMWIGLMVHSHSLPLGWLCGISLGPLRQWVTFTHPPSCGPVKCTGAKKCRDTHDLLHTHECTPSQARTHTGAPLPLSKDKAPKPEVIVRALFYFWYDLKIQDLHDDWLWFRHCIIHILV